MAEGCTGTETQTKTITEATEESEAVTADITVYTGGKSFNGDTPITRGEAAAVVYGCIKAEAGDELEIPAEQQGDFADEDEIPAEYLDAVKALRALNILYGYDDGEFKADKTITRAEAVKLASEASGYCGFAELEALTAAQQG